MVAELLDVASNTMHTLPQAACTHLADVHSLLLHRLMQGRAVSTPVSVAAAASSSGR
jgi:hypothetical protein